MKTPLSSLLALGSLLALSPVLDAAARASAQTGPSMVRQSEEHRYRVVPVVEGLVNPWSMAFLPNGDMLVTERPGRLRIVRAGRLDPNPIEGVPEVRARGQGGLLDVALHPQFATNQILYLSYSKPHADGNQSTTAVARARLDGNRLADVREIFEAKAWSTTNGHYGSRLAFDREGHLYITVSDRQAPPSGDLAAHPAQDRSNHQGTIVRLNDDGSVPGDNPFVGQAGVLPEIWSYGHRSLQGLVFHPETGDLWESEHGPQGGDELNLILPGRNYGWPVVGYGVNYNSGLAIHEGTMKEGMEGPKHFWVPSIATAGMTVYTGNAFPRWKGNAFVGGMAGQQLARLVLDGQNVVAEETLVRGLGRIRDVKQGPDGFIYLAVEDRGGQPSPIVRLEPATVT